MLEIIRPLTKAAPALVLPPAVKGPTISAVKQALTMEATRVGHALFREAANRLREAKMKAANGTKTKAASLDSKEEMDIREPLIGDSPTVLVSYSWESDEHKDWVRDFCRRLRAESGVNVIADFWHLRPGDDRTYFMEHGVSTSDFVLLVCTPAYAEKANSREGGVGYEATIITSQLAQQIRQNKFIPVLRRGDWTSALPIWIQSKVGVDMRGDPYDEKQYELLLRTVHQAELKAPAVGPKPIFPEQNESKSSQSSDNAVTALLKSTAAPLATSRTAVSGTARRGAIAYALYETKGSDAHRVQTYVRPVDEAGNAFRFETSLGEHFEGPKLEVAQRFLTYDMELKLKGYTRMQSSNSSGEQLFNLPF
jgi:hypothetical protein